MAEIAGHGAVWKSDDLTRTFLTGVRGAIPLAAEQLAILVRLVERAQPELKTFMDLGCGDGILGAALAKRFPESTGMFLDFSKPMLEAARARFSAESSKHTFIECDYGSPDWLERVHAAAPFDAIVSGFSIHHQPDDRKKWLYDEIFGMLKPGGIFLNLEHVASASKWVEGAFDELFVDSLYAHHTASGGKKSKAEIAQEYYFRPDKAANMLMPVEKQCLWLRGIGFKDVDIYLKVFELALFGGVRP